MKQLLLNMATKIRCKLNPYQSPTSEVWGEMKNYNMFEFSKVLHKYRRTSDRCHVHMKKNGNMDSFFDDIKEGKSTDEYARAWLTWGVLNGYDAYEYTLTSLKYPLTDSHVITILKRGNEDYVLCNNYRLHWGFTSVERILKYMRVYSGYYKEGFIFSKAIEVTNENRCNN